MCVDFALEEDGREGICPLSEGSTAEMVRDQEHGELSSSSPHLQQHGGSSWFSQLKELCPVV